MIKPGDFRLILHQIGNLLQPIDYHIKRITELESDDAVFRAAKEVLPGRLEAMERMLARLRMLAKPMQPQRNLINLGSLVKSVWRDVLALKHLNAVAATLELPAECQVFADEALLHQALRELLLNAAEAAITTPQPEVRVRLAADQHYWRIAIEDSGPGIPRGAMDFALFFTTKSETGAGLGLPLAKHILEAHAGSLSFRSQRGDKTHVTAFLPQTIQ